MLKHSLLSLIVALIGLSLLGCSKPDPAKVDADKFIEGFVVTPQTEKTVRITESTTLVRPDGIRIHVSLEYDQGGIARSDNTYLERGRKTYELAIAHLISGGKAIPVVMQKDGSYTIPDTIPSRHDLAFAVDVRPSMGEHVFAKAYCGHPGKCFVLIDDSLHVAEIASLPDRLTALYEAARQVAPIAGTCVDEQRCR